MEEPVETQEENISQQDSSTGLIHSMTHPSGFIFRFVGLLLLCFVGFGSYFCYDNPAALQDYIQEDLNLTKAQYTMLYSVYSWPNVFLGFVGGFLIDSVFGIRMGSNIYMSLTLIGQLCCSTGVWMGSYWMMLLGRFIFGLGGESLAVAQNNYAVLWFKGRVLNMVFGLQLSFARIGSTVNFMVMEDLYNSVEKSYPGIDGLAITFYLATLTCVFSFICCLLLGFMDIKTERVLRLHNTIPSDPVKMSDVKYFNKKFWLLNVVIVFFYVAVFPFIAVGKTFFMEQFNMSPSDANRICSIVYLISGFASPALGFIIDRTGRNLLWIITGVSLTMVAHACLTFFTWINPYISMSCMGIAYSILASSLWPLISLVIPEHQLGTAYGVCSALQNSGLAMFTSIVGFIIDHWGYTWCEIFFISNLSIALIATFIIFLWDLCQGDVLNLSPSARLQHQQRALNKKAVQTWPSVVWQAKAFSNLVGIKTMVLDGTNNDSEGQLKF
ncbi:hypothetical protein HHI36_003945 [Cryptolaemus montrouzieri]|uniref:Lysosomal dipeptide transporter MFSD1 n=1 Tax=Cryptolaemus montrouzieri TaxID=559131 RepID=A0ABD2NQ02_9CUCU